MRKKELRYYQLNTMCGELQSRGDNHFVIKGKDNKEYLTTGDYAQFNNELVEVQGLVVLGIRAYHQVFILNIKKI
jgi:hypothetical protein